MLVSPTLALIVLEVKLKTLLLTEGGNVSDNTS